MKNGWNDVYNHIDDNSICPRSAKNLSAPVLSTKAQELINDQSKRGPLDAWMKEKVEDCKRDGGCAGQDGRQWYYAKHSISNIKEYEELMKVYLMAIGDLDEKPTGEAQGKES